MAAYAYHAMVLGYTDGEVNRFFAKALFAIGEDWGMDDLLPLVLEVGEKNYRCMALLDKANTETYGTPEPTTVPLTVEKGPFIVVSGHDLHDLKRLLEQTEGKGINIYTHSEMLPAHGYPGLKKYAHLKGNFGTAWQNQQKEFADIPAPVLFTTNCLMPPKASYADRVFTTAVVSYPELKHIGADKDFTPVIEKALELGGYAEDKAFTGINGGSTVTTGFARGAVLGVADKVVEAVNSGRIRHFFLVGGCDGARPGRNYYTEFVKQTPPDTMVLTLACGKFRFNDLDLGTVAGLPRILDIGQCNDAYSAIQIALALADAFGCGGRPRIVLPCELQHVIRAVHRHLVGILGRGRAGLVAGVHENRAEGDGVCLGKLHRLLLACGVGAAELDAARGLRLLGNRALEGEPGRYVGLLEAELHLAPGSFIGQDEARVEGNHIVKPGVCIELLELVLHGSLRALGAAGICRVQRQPGFPCCRAGSCRKSNAAAAACPECHPASTPRGGSP